MIRKPSVKGLPEGYAYGATRNADVLIRGAAGDKFADIVSVLEGFQVFSEEIFVGGGNRSGIAKRFDGTLGSLPDWGKANITINRSASVNNGPSIETTVKSHEIDMFSGSLPGVAVEMEWNNKDTFFDRDLRNFQALYQEGVIVAGVIVTRGPGLQAVLKRAGLPKFGESTTHWGKLTGKVEANSWEGCPLLLVGIEPDRVTGLLS